MKDTAGNDDELTEKICAYLRENAPAFLFVQFDDVDGAGHHFGYGTEGHLNQIRTTDGYIKRVWDVCRERGFLDDGLFLVTADHGGFDHGHGGWTDGEKYVMFAAAGPDVAHGTIGDMAIRDTASVVLYALGLEDRQPASWSSRVPSGLFRGVEAKERPAGMKKPTPKPEAAHRLHQPTDAPAGECVTDLFPADRVAAYLPFDGGIADASGHIETERGGKLYFTDGWFSSAVQVQDGYVTLKDLDLGTESFTVCFWMKADSPGGSDPVFLGNKDWRGGGNPGFALVLTSGIVSFNASDGRHRSDAGAALPPDFVTGWTHVTAAVDREANEVRYSFDFGPMKASGLVPEAKGTSFSTDMPLNIGTDGTCAYKYRLPAALDEFLILRGALTEGDTEKLKKFYLG